jgi:hypothetical protein
MSRTKLELPNLLNFHWLPKHLNHIAENIVFQERNVSFYAINALFRQKKTHLIIESPMQNGHFIIEDFVDLQTNDLLRRRAERLTAVYYLDNRDNVVVVTAFSENDKRNE